MKKQIAFLGIFFNVLLLFAQSPQSFQYQSVVHDGNGDVVVSQPVSFQISLISGSATGTVEYVETHSLTTNSFGLVFLAIGEGAVVSGSFAGIDWSSAAHFIKVEVDITGGTAYIDMGTMQLLSVPYALYAEQSGTGGNSLWDVNGNNIFNTNTGYVGVGTTSPPGKMVVQGDASMNDTIPLFEVKDRTGATVFIVYPDSVRVYVKDDGTKSNKGAFAVSGRNTAKQMTNNFLLVTPDSSRVYTGDQTKGFGVKNIGITTKNSYLQMTPNNYFIGHDAGKLTTSGLYNTFIGYQSGLNNTTGYKNYFVGYKAGFSNLSGYWNLFIGDSTGYNNTTGANNIFIGNKSGYSNTIGWTNIYVGYLAGYNNIDGNYNIGIGFKTMYLNTSGIRNTAIGEWSLGDNTSGSFNTATGVWALTFNTTGTLNTAAGFESLLNNTTGNNNTAFGTDALRLNTTGNFNTAVGYYAFANGAAYESSTAIGYNANITASNQVRVGTITVTSIGGYVGWTTLPSDKRFKKNIVENVPGLSFITKLRPVTYNMDMEAIADFLHTPDSILQKDQEILKSNMLQTGFIAQEVEKAANDVGFDFCGVDKPKNKDDFYGLRYAEFTVPLVKAVQELNDKNLEQQTYIEKLQQEIELLKEEIKNIKASL